jgi:hypothetical protein
MRLPAALLAAGFVASAVGVAVSAGAGVANAGPPSVRQLTGTLRLSPGTCAGGRPAGSYLSVTFGTRAVRNSASHCENGAVTLLSPGRGGLSTQQFSPVGDLSFDGAGNARSDTISRPARFGHHAFGLVTAARNLQDAPRAAPAFALPRLYLVGGNHVVADLRSVQILYGGFAGSSCASASGYGCWLVGAERATGSYDPRSHQISLSWFSGQSFTPASAGTQIHLVGRFTGAPRAVKQGTTVELGTASFDAGATHPVAAVAGSTARGASGPHRFRGRHARRRARAKARLEAHSTSTTTGSPRTFLLGEILVLLDLVAFAALAPRRGRK